MRVVGDHHERQQEVVPRPGEHQHDQGEDGRPGDRDEDPPEDLPRRRAVDPRRLDQLDGGGPEEGPHPERPEAHLEPRLRQDQRPVRVRQPQATERVVERDDDRLERDDDPGDQHVEQHVREREADDTERVAGRDRGHRRQHDDRHRHDQARRHQRRERAALPGCGERVEAQRLGQADPRQQRPGRVERRQQDADERRDRRGGEQQRHDIVERSLAARRDHPSRASSSRRMPTETTSTRIVRIVAIAAAEPTSPLTKARL